MHATIQFRYVGITILLKKQNNQDLIAFGKWNFQIDHPRLIEQYG